MYNNFFNPMQKNNNNFNNNNYRNTTNQQSVDQYNNRRNQQSGYSQSTSNQINSGYQDNSNYQQKNYTEKAENSNSSFRSGPDLMNNQKLSGIDPVKLKIIMEISEKSKNKSVEELLPEIMKINQELNRRNMNFSKNETEILMDVIEESLSPADRQRFNMIKGFLN
ncbi:MAG: hypothetical protein IJ224_11615 [Lachnospiraceae bacterium]|nr:hypothetical protein [Lachnospiraceae bacterium]